MELTRRSFLVYALLGALWVLVVGWQIEEHVRVREAAKTDLRNRSKDIANTLSAIIRGLRFRGVIPQDRLEPILNELVNGRTNELVKSSELVSIVLLNAANEQIASAGKPVDADQKEIIQSGERWAQHSVTLVNPIDLGASLTSEGGTNPTVVLQPPHDLTNRGPETFRGRSFPRPETRPEDAGSTNLLKSSSSNSLAVDLPPPPPPERETRRREGESRPRRPFWLRGMDEKEYQSLVEKRALHGLVLGLSTDSFQAATTHDFWLRSIIVILATISALGTGVVWREIARSSELQL